MVKHLSLALMFVGSNPACILYFSPGMGRKITFVGLFPRYLRHFPKRNFIPSLELRFSIRQTGRNRGSSSWTANQTKNFLMSTYQLFSWKAWRTCWQGGWRFEQYTVIRFVSMSAKFGICKVVGLKWPLLKLKYAIGHLHVRIVASKSVQFRFTTVDMSNLAPIETKQITV